MESPFFSTYLRFLQLSKALSDGAGMNLDANCRALLEAVALAWYAGSSMSVRQAMALDSLGSPATLHKRLTILRAEGYLEEGAAQGDKKTKLLIPTQKALGYFETLSHVMALPQPVA